MTFCTMRYLQLGLENTFARPNIMLKYQRTGKVSNLLFCIRIVVQQIIRDALV